MRSREHALFTIAEEQAMARRLAGDHTDPTGIYVRVREKLKEIQAWHTPQMRTLIKKLLAYQHKTETDDTPIVPDEKSFDEFTQEVGY